MPEPGVSDRNFDHPTTDRNPGTDRERSDREAVDPSDRNGYRRRRGRMRLPAEYGDFRLADGRTLREVLGDRFFGAAGRFGGTWLSRGPRERVRQDAPPVPPPLAGWGDRVEELRARAGARRAERQARIDDWRQRMRAWPTGRPGGGFESGGGR